MKLEIKGYADQYKQGVLKCLKNNYSWMAEISDEQLYEWAKPFMEYDWKDRLSEHSYAARIYGDEFAIFLPCRGL